MASKLIPVHEVKPGQQFSCWNVDYVRATDEEVRKHPARGVFNDREVVYAYTGTLPVTFTHTTEVVVKGGGAR